MKVQTARRRVWLGLGLLWMVAAGASSARAGSGSQRRPTIGISVYNDAGLKHETLLRAEENAAAVFRRAGIETEWSNCGTERIDVAESKRCREVAYPARLVLRIERRPRGLIDEPLGVAYLSADGQGAYCDVFLEPMLELQQIYALSLDALLGHVAAHEVGHLLLGLHSHSVNGLMRAQWSLQTVEEMKRGTLEFNSSQSSAMVERLEVAQANAKESLTTMAEDAPPEMMRAPATHCRNSH